MIPNTKNQRVPKESAEPEDGKKSARLDRGRTLVPTRVGRNTVDIDVPALRHLVDKVKSKLMPPGKSD